MIREKFEEAANQLGCKYQYYEKRLVSLTSRNIPTSYHNIALEYNSVIINLIYEFGNHHLGKVNTVIKTNREDPNFSVTTKSQIHSPFTLGVTGGPNGWPRGRGLVFGSGRSGNIYHILACNS